MKEFKVTIPEGMEIDKENSTFECIKFKPIKSERWRDNKEALIGGYYITNSALIMKLSHPVENINCNHNVFATEKQVRSALAMARISQIMINDKRFGGVVTNEEWGDDMMYKRCIERVGNKISPTGYYSVYKFLAFHTPQQRDLFLIENEDLIKDYLMID